MTNPDWQRGWIIGFALGQATNRYDNSDDIIAQAKDICSLLHIPSITQEELERSKELAILSVDIIVKELLSRLHDNP